MRAAFLKKSPCMNAYRDFFVLGVLHLSLQ